MDSDKIFNLFEPNNPKEDKKSLEPNDLLIIDYKDHPYYIIKMFVKLMVNHDVFSKKFTNIFKNNGAKLDVEDIKKAGIFFTNEKAWEYISKIDINIPIHLESLLELKSELLINNINKLLLYYQNIEEYEKCAFLFNIIKKIENSSL